MSRNSFSILSILIFFLLCPSLLVIGQTDGSPSNWLFPDGNYSATKYNNRVSVDQDITKFKIKIVNEKISGDLQPLIGNLVDNDKISAAFPYGPNELAVVSGRDILILDGAGRLYTRTLDNSILPIKGISMLFDSLATAYQENPNGHVIMAFETIESVSEDSLAHSYLAGYDNENDEIVLHKRLAIDMRRYPQNIYNSIRPFFARFSNSSIDLLTTLDIYNPIVDSTSTAVPYLRGIANFSSDIEFPNFPLPDIGDDTLTRLELSNRIGIEQPSITQLPNGNTIALMPMIPNTNLGVTITNRLGNVTNSDSTYLYSYNISSNNVSNYLPPVDITSFMSGSKPYVRPYIIELNNGSATTQQYILQTEQYQGFGGSRGVSKLHLLDINGNFITTPNGPIPTFVGDSNHYWSIATGDIDGTNNEWLPFYPNNPGKEIIATQSSRNFTHANSRIFILKYNTVDTIAKPTPPDTRLFPFDTIAAAKINGRVVAVNDMDNNPDEKDEIVIVDGSKLMVLGLRQYEDELFRAGHPMDTLYYKDFDKEDIYAVEVADMDGDGLNDLIVTTFKATYIIGTPLTNILTLLEPTTQLTPPEEYCPGDSIELLWENKILGIGDVDIDFVYAVNDSTEDTLSVKTNITNDMDTVSYYVKLDSIFIGKEGHFVVKSSIEPNEVNDSSATVKILDIELTNFAVSDTVITVGDVLTVNGDINCYDSILVETNYLDSTWTELIIIQNSGSQSFVLNDTIPCLPIFSCQGEDLDSIYNYRIIAYKDIFSKELASYSVKVLPTEFPIVIEPENTVDPTQRFSWDPMDLVYPCDTITIMASYNGGMTYSLLDQVSIDDASYIWQVPLDAPDDVKFRFCCESSCVRTDTLINDIAPNFIDVVAPNPFDPNLNEVEFVYQVPESGNITIKILDESNRTVVTIADNEFRQEGFAHTDRWDGRLPNGDFVANGMYYLYIEFSDGNREFHPIFVKR
jgi:hypothetical protein